MVNPYREACRRVKAEAKLVVQFKFLVSHRSIYVVHDAKVQLYFYIASDILKKVEKKNPQPKFLPELRIHLSDQSQQRAMCP
jgi:hypothetical protein